MGAPDAMSGWTPVRRASSSRCSVALWSEFLLAMRRAPPAPAFLGPARTGGKYESAPPRKNPLQRGTGERSRHRWGWLAGSRTGHDGEGGMVGSGGRAVGCPRASAGRRGRAGSINRRRRVRTPCNVGRASGRGTDWGWLAGSGTGHGGEGGDGRLPGGGLWVVLGLQQAGGSGGKARIGGGVQEPLTT